MKEEKYYFEDSLKLRQKAEEQILKEKSDSNIPDTEADMLKLIHELKVHQVELEMQNEELLHSKAIANDAVKLYDLAPTGYFTLSNEGTILKLNLCGAQMLGKDRARLINSRLGFFISDETKPVYNNFLDKVFLRNRSESCEVILTTHGNLRINVQLTGKASEKGQQCLVIMADITESKQAVEVLRRSEVCYRTLFENGLTGIFITQPDGTILNANPEACRMLGRSEKEICRLGRNGVVNLADPNLTIALTTRMQTGNFCGELTFVHADGTIFPVYLVSNIVPTLTGQLNTNIFFIDITVRKKAENKLNESERRYRELVENSPDAILIYVGGKIEFVNKECLRLMAVSHEEDLVGKSVIQFVHPDCRAMVSARMRKVANEGGILPLVEEKFVRTDGSEVDVEVKAMSIMLGNKSAIQLIVRDITDRKHAEEALRISERQYRDMFYKNTAIKLIIDPVRGDILHANEAASKFYGYPVDKLVSMNINQINTLQAEQITAEMTLALSERRKYFDFRHRLASGEVRDVEVYSGPIEYGGNTRLYSIIHDVTDRKRAQALLVQLNWRLESIVESTRIGTWEWNIQTGEAVFNERWAQIIGYSLDELAPVSINTWQTLSHPDDLKNSTKFLERHFSGELPYYNFDCRMKHKDGHWVWVLDRGRVVKRTEDGKPLIMFGTHSDITERKKVEETLRMNEAELLRINAEKDKFFSIIAHDLRSPFNGFLGLTEIMVEGLSGMTRDEIQQMAVLIRKSALNLFSLLGNLLEWSRMQRGLMGVLPSSFLLMPKISESMVLVKDAADNKEILISYLIPGDLKVFTDGNMLGGILRNLVTNAVKFTPKGGIIVISARSIPGNLVEISVRDTGIGMSKGLIDDLFRLDVNTGRKGTDGESSTGLGLMICKDFIEKNGGKLYIESEVGKGSDFKFTVPMNSIAVKEK